MVWNSEFWTLRGHRHRKGKKKAVSKYTVPNCIFTNHVHIFPCLIFLQKFYFFPFHNFTLIVTIGPHGKVTHKQNGFFLLGHYCNARVYCGKPWWGFLQISLTVVHRSGQEEEVFWDSVCVWERGGRGGVFGGQAAGGKQHPRVVMSGAGNVRRLAAISPSAPQADGWGGTRLKRRASTAAELHTIHHFDPLCAHTAAYLAVCLPSCLPAPPPPTSPPPSHTASCLPVQGNPVSLMEYFHLSTSCEVWERGKSKRK